MKVLRGRRYAVLFGRSPNSLTKEVVERDFAEPGAYFPRRITQMMKTENVG